MKTEFLILTHPSPFLRLPHSQRLPIRASPRHHLSPSPCARVSVSGFGCFVRLYERWLMRVVVIRSRLVLGDRIAVSTEKWCSSLGPGAKRVIGGERIVGPGMNGMSQLLNQVRRRGYKRKSPPPSIAFTVNSAAALGLLKGAMTEGKGIADWRLPTADWFLSHL